MKESAPKIRPSRREIIESVKLSARIAGCTCEANVTLREVRPGIFIADLAHESGCRHPSQIKGGDA